MAKLPSSAPNEADEPVNEDTVRLKVSAVEVKTIPLICPWCNRLFKVSRWEVEYGRKTGASHGICPECFAQQVKERGQNGSGQTQS